MAWRTNGQTGSTGHRISNSYAYSGIQWQHYNTANVVADSNGKIEVVCSVAGAHKLAVYTDGWYFPVGM
jgi:hypothetical protein